MAAWGARDIQEKVPEATEGTWWIAFTAECGLDSETYRRLSIHCEDFREDVWTLNRKQKWSQHKLEVVEAKIKALRFLRGILSIDAAEAGSAAPDADTAAHKRRRLAWPPTLAPSVEPASGRCLAP